MLGSATLHPPGSPIPIGAYARISEDPEDTRVGVDEQQRDNDDMATRNGCVIVDRYIDNDLSAADRDVYRHDFERLLTDLESGRIRGLAGYNLDRLVRQMTDLERLLKIYEDHPEYVFLSATNISLNLSTSDGRLVARLLTAVAAREVEELRRRVARRNYGFARDGKAHTGRRAFGWNSDGTLHFLEASLIRQAHTDLLAGVRVGTIRKRWIAAGIQPARSGKNPGHQSLSHTSVELRLLNPRLCGYRVYIPQAARRRKGAGRPWLPHYVVHDDGKPVVGDWEPVLSVEEWEAAVLEVGRRKGFASPLVRGDEVEAHRLPAGNVALRPTASFPAGKKPHDTTPVHLLSGIAICGKCGHGLRASLYRRGTPAYEKYRHRYQCMTNLGGCGSIARVGPPIDQLVEAALLAEHRRHLGEVGKPLPDYAGDARLAELEAEIATYLQARRDGELSPALLVKLLGPLEAEREALAQTRRAFHTARLKREAEAVQLDTEWAAMAIEQRRALIRKSIQAVVVHPAGRGKRFDPDLVEILWKS